RRHGGFLVIWAAVTLAMTYVPVSFQRKMIEGVHIPLSILAASGWLALGRRWRVPARIWMAVLLFLTLPSNLALMADSVRRLITNNAEGVAQQLPPYYLDADERGALDWLAAHARPEDVVLSTPALGNYIPPYTGATAYASHWAETIHLGVKWRWVRGFLQEYTSDEWRMQFLRQERIRYVYHGAIERLVGEFDPSRAPYLRPVFRRGAVGLYEVVLP
ncbi:MAG: hypothetical protein QHJ73_00345, partial [Armatimonadota bacterium]|nr:hypothetical protein [Armatimonadota bacterium]